MIDQGPGPWPMLAFMIEMLGMFWMLGMLGMHLIANQTHNCSRGDRANIVLRPINIFHLPNA